MIKNLILSLSLLLALCATGCGTGTNPGDGNQTPDNTSDNGNTGGDDDDASSVSISSFTVTSDNPAISSVVTLDIQTEGAVTGYLIHERKTTDDNESIIPSLSDSRWTGTCPTEYTLSDPQRYGTKILYLFIRDKDGKLAERKSVTVCYQNANPVFTRIADDMTGSAIIDPTVAVSGNRIFIACCANKTRSTLRTACYPTVLMSDDSGKNWSTIYTSADKAMFTSIATDQSGKVYLAMRSTSAANRLVVLKYAGSGSTWNFLGSASGISAGTANNVKIVASKSGLFVCCADYGLSADGSSASAAVYRYSSSNDSWSLLGGTAASEGAASDTDMVIAEDGNVFIAFCDEGLSRKASVRRYASGSGWTYAGSRGISDGIATFTRLAETDEGIALTYRDGTINPKPAAMIFAGSGWKNLGPVPCDGSMVSSCGDIIFCNGSLNVFVKETIGDGSLRCSCMRYSSGKWNYVGGQGFSTYSTDYIDTIESEGSIYLVFKNWGNTAAPYTYGLSLIRFY